jgi:hypothetical protein
MPGDGKMGQNGHHSDTNNHGAYDPSWYRFDKSLGLVRGMVLWAERRVWVGGLVCSD